MLRLPEVSLSSPLIFACVYSDLSHFSGSYLRSSLSLLPPPPLLTSVILAPPSFHSLPLFLSLPPLTSSPVYFPTSPQKTPLCLHTLNAFFIFTRAYNHLSIPPSLRAACSHRWSLLRPGYKPAPGGFPAGVGSDGVHWEQGQADLCHLLRLQWPQCGFPGDQEWTAEEGESSNTLTDTVEQHRLDLPHWTRTLRNCLVVYLKLLILKGVQPDPLRDKWHHLSTQNTTMISTPLVTSSGSVSQT